MPTRSSITTKMMIGTATQEILPVETVLAMFAIAGITLAAIDAKMMNEIPLPMPFSVIFSPIHMRRATPAVAVTPIVTYVSQLVL